MEPDFNDIALAKFLQTAPELGGLILTFKDVSSDLQEDSDIKVGVFILRSGEEVFYVPVVSKADNVYPMDSIFFVSRNKFFPLTKKTISVVLNASQLTQGRSKKIPKTVPLNPDVTQLINPPRTGKFVSASSSRLGDFLATMPQYLKDFTFEKVAEEKSVYENLNKLFAIGEIFTALKKPSESMAKVTNQVPISIVTGVDSNTLDSGAISSILNDGYHVSGTQPTNRVAVSSVNYEDTKFTKITELDGNSDYEVVFDRGNSREAFIPKMMDIGASSNNNKNTVALFTNGDYAISQGIVAKGTKLDRTLVLESIFSNTPPVLPRDVTVGETFAIIDSDASLLGIFRANKVTLSHLGVEIDASVRAGNVPSYEVKICAYRNYGSKPSVEAKHVYLPFSSLVLMLGDDVSMDLERSENSASRKQEISEAGILGEQINLGFDGVEFSVNGKSIGKEASVMERLVVEEGIDPELATTFVKQAKERRFTKIYLSKKASSDFRPGEIPQFGDAPPPQGKTGLNGSFMPNVQKSLSIGDAQATEATIISELLQAPDMIELIDEYLPDIEEAIDKLGRILFLSRVHISQLSNNNDADGVFGFLSSLKNVYRMLGDNLIKLQELVALRPTIDNSDQK